MQVARPLDAMRSAVLFLAAISATRAFAPPARVRAPTLRRAEGDEAVAEAATTEAAPAAGAEPSDEEVSAALKDKMMSWEATEAEQKAATLGGLIPGSSGADGFDIGLYIAFPFLFGSLCLFLFFPLIGSAPPASFAQCLSSPRRFCRPATRRSRRQPRRLVRRPAADVLGRGARLRHKAHAWASYLASALPSSFSSS